MNKYDYITQIEKTAAEDIKDKSLPAKLRDSFIEMKVNDAKKGVLKFTGAALGTGLALKKGVPLGKAITNGGIGGMAIGDIAGSAIIPTASLYKKHQREFGAAPDIKTTGKLLAANVLPTAGFWGGVYGTKAGLKYRNSIASGLQKGVNTAKTKVSQIKGNVDGIFGDEEFMGRMGKALTSGDNALAKGAKKEIMDRSWKAVTDPIIGDVFGGGRINPEARSRLVKGGVTAIAPGIAMESLNIPAMYATPSNLINAKKRRIEQGE